MKLSLILVLLAVIFGVLSIFTALPLWICIGFLCGAVAALALGK